MLYNIWNIKKMVIYCYKLIKKIGKKLKYVMQSYHYANDKG